jgi:hypothetical protein
MLRSRRRCPRSTSRSCQTRGWSAGPSSRAAHTASTVRVKEDDALVTDGPFADTKEVFGGYYLIEADDLDAAIQVAARIPAARLGGSVEIRPIVTPPPA